ncbi:MAG: DNA/RNA non-specific endonuclease [Sulfurospirillaceae bacterium]|nr:DNA/RNA non-specific endonuclease [Sulfurospirillaceae bacterium]
MKKLLLLSILTLSLYATNLSDFVNTSKCDQIIDKQLYHICYSYKYKGALSGWVRLDGSLVNKNNIKRRMKFYSEKTIPVQYRSKSKDYRGYGKDWNRGHFIVSDADFDYDHKALRKAYTMANIVPQSAMVNQKTWIKVERYGRALAQKLGYINSISIAKYDNPNHTIRNHVVIPSTLYRIYYNNKAHFEKCFKYDNVLNVDYRHDKLKDHVVDCYRIKEIAFDK